MFLILWSPVFHFYNLLIVLLVPFLKKRNLLFPRSQRVSSMTFSRNFVILALTFRSIIHFKLIFVQSEDIKLFQHHTLKTLSFPHWITLATLATYTHIHAHTESFIFTNIAIIDSALQCFLKEMTTTDVKKIAFFLLLSTFPLFLYLSAAWLWCFQVWISVFIILGDYWVFGPSDYCFLI